MLLSEYIDALNIKDVPSPINFAMKYSHISRENVMEMRRRFRSGLFLKKQSAVKTGKIETEPDLATGALKSRSINSHIGKSLPAYTPQRYSGADKSDGFFLGI